MKCPSCGNENPALAERCSECGKPFSRPEDNQTLENIDRESLSKHGEKPVGKRAPRTKAGGGAEGHARGGGGGGTTPLSENLRDPQVMSKTPSGVGPNAPGSQEDLDDGTVFNEESSAAPSTGSPTGYGRRSSLSYSVSGILEPGMDFGPRFRIEKLLGEGGMGKVYKALDKELGRTVALKTLQPELTKDPSVILRFKQELLLASKISHKNILRIHDLSEWEGVKFITMAFIEGNDLNQLLKEERPFPIERSLKIARQLCEALDAAHSEGVVHRDFKPHNILVGKNDHVYVSDFGLATSLETAKLGMTRTGAFVGTPRYMSPEHVEGKQIDSRSDLYSFGLVFYEMVAGELPFASESTWQVMYQRVNEQPNDIKLVDPDVPDNVARIIMHCLEREPADRYQSARDIIADIDAGRSPEMSVTSINRTPSSGRSVQITIPVVQKRWWYVAAAGAFVLAGLFFASPKTRHWVLTAYHAETPETENKALGSKSQANLVAVLPFNVVGDESSLRYVAEGLVEALSARLFQLRDVRLASSAASAKVDPKASLSLAAKELGANLIVHGTVQGSGVNLRVAIALDNVAENRLVWSQEFTGVRGDLLILEDHMYERLAEALALKPSNEELARATAHPTENIEAYDLYLKGRAAMRGQEAISNIKKAIGLYEEALKKDPSFALAYAGIADATLILYDQKKDGFLAQKALGAAQQAQRLNDNLPEVHFSLGKVYNASGRTAEAIIELKRALELAPNSDDGYRALGKAYLTLGQKEQALQAYQKAVNINPYYWINYNTIGQAYSQLGEYDQSLIALRHVIELEPQNSFGYLNVGVVYFQQGKYEESIPYFQKSLQIQPDDKTYSDLGTAYFYLKRYSDSVPMFEKAVQMNPNVEEFTGNLADAYRWSGQREKANATYDKAIALAYKELAVNPRNSDTMGSLALYYAKKGMPSQALNFIQRARSINKEDVGLVYTAAVVEALADHPDNALGFLREAFKRGYSVTEASSDPELNSLRSRPEFAKLLAEFKKGS